MANLFDPITPVVIFDTACIREPIDVMQQKLITVEIREVIHETISCEHEACIFSRDFPPIEPVILKIIILIAASCKMT